MLTALLALLPLSLAANTPRVTSGNLVVEFSDDNGAITAIKDQSSGIIASSGSQNGCLWGFTDLQQQYAGGCMFSKAAGTFDATPTPSGGLLMTFNGTAGAGIVQVAVEPSLDDALDMELTVTTPPTTKSPAQPFTQLLWPSELMFDATRTSAAVLPLMPGLWLGQAAFNQGDTPSPTLSLGYPGRGIFADVAWVRMNATPVERPTVQDPEAVDLAAAPLPGSQVSLAVTTVTDQLPSPELVNPASRVIPTALTIKPASNASARTWVYSHAFIVNITSATPLGSGVSFKTRILLNPSLAKAGSASMQASGLNQTGAAAHLADRLGGPHKAAWMLAAPLIKMDAVELGLQFSEYAAKVLPALPRPSLVHLAAIEPGGFDHDYPDILPPAKQWGTTLELRALVQQAQSMGHLFMPYTNPTWWDTSSPTVTHELPRQGLSMRDITAWNTSMQPVVECYGPNCGVAVSPASPFVQQRIADLAEQIVTLNMTNHGPGIGSDAAFADQIGARPMLRDENPATCVLAKNAFGEWGEAVGGSAGFARGWQQYLWQSSEARVHTEQGFDKLLATGPEGQPGVGGFHGQWLLQQFSGKATAGFCANGSGTTPGRDPQSGACFRAVPLAQLMFRQLVPLHQHDLAQQEFDFNPLQLAWDTAMGLQLALLVGASPCTNISVACPWAHAIAAMQREVVAPTANHQIAAFYINSWAMAETWHTSLAPPQTSGSAPYPAGPSHVDLVVSRGGAGSPPYAWEPKPIAGLAVSSLPVSVASPGFGARRQVVGSAPSAATTSQDETLPWQTAEIGSLAGLFSLSFLGRPLSGEGSHFVLEQYGVNTSAWIGGPPATAAVTAVWHPFGAPSSIAAPGLQAWGTSSSALVAPFQRSVFNRTVSVESCGPPAPLPIADGIVEVPASAFDCHDGHSAAFAALWA